MSKFDRYVLSQLLVLFGFFSLILVAVFWINKAVSLFDKLIGDGQSAMVFLQFSALTLPSLIEKMIPVASFAATVYVTNRLNNESELTVMQATGSSPWRLARPVIAFGLVIMVMMSFLTHLLVPISVQQLELREAEITRNVTAKLLSEGEFLHPSSGVTFYIGSIDPDGGLNNVYLSDRREPSKTVTYTSAAAYLVRNGTSTNLIMVDGMAQQYVSATQRLSTTSFSDFSYDISALTQRDTARGRTFREVTTFEMFGKRDQISAETNARPAQVAREMHDRFAAPLFSIAAALVGFSTLLMGGFSRFGVWRQAAFALAILISLEAVRSALVGPLERNDDLWPVLYIPALLGLLISALFLFIAARPTLLRPSRLRGAT